MPFSQNFSYNWNIFPISSIQQPQTVSNNSGGGMSIPEAFIIAEIKFEIKHINSIVSKFLIFTNNIFILTSFKVTIENVILKIKSYIENLHLKGESDGLLQKSFTENLHLKGESDGLE